MGIAGLSIRRPILVYVFLMMMGILGLVGVTRMGIEFFPEVDIPYVVVITAYPGASLWEVEAEVTERIEDQLAMVPKMKRMDSDSREGISIIMMEFFTDADVDTAASDVRDRLGMVEPWLPADAEKPMVLKFDLNAMPIIDIAISARRPTSEIKQYVEDYVRDRLSQIDGVANVQISGGRDREVEVRVERAALQRYGISITDVVQIIRASNLNYPVGRIKRDKEEISIRVVGEVKDPSELEELRIPTIEGLIPLGDIAEVRGWGLTELVQYGRMKHILNGEERTGEAVIIYIAKQAGANTAAVSRAVAREMQRIRQDMPEDYNVVITRDQSEFIVESLNATRNALLLGAGLAAFMVLLFLGNIRTTIIIALAIPIAVLGAFMLMYFSGFTLNIMSLLALTISVGMMVDNSVVILENIYRHMEMGKTPVRAAIEGTQEISLAVMASALTNIIVFSSFAFMSGMVGQFFKQFGLTICFVYICSLIMAFTLTPTMMAHFLKARDYESLRSLAEAGDRRSFDKVYKAVESVYRGVVGWALGHRWVVVAATVFIFFSSFALLGFRMIGFEFFPEPDMGEIDIVVELPVSASLEQTNETMGMVEEIVSAMPELELYTLNAGGSGSMFAFGDPEPRYGRISINLKDERERSTDEVMDHLRREVAELPGGAAFTITTTDMGGGGWDADIMIDVAGPDFGVLAGVAEEVLGVVRNVPGAANVSSSWKVGKPELEVRIRNRDAQALGLTVAQIGMQLRTGIYGDDSANFRDVTGREYDIRVRLREQDRLSIDHMRNFPIVTPLGGQVALADVADIARGAAPIEIKRKNRQRIVAIKANTAGRTLGDVVRDIDHALEQKIEAGELDLPPGYTYEFYGEAEEMKEMMNQMLLALGLGILFVFFVMAAQFNSFFHPLAIMASVPLALIGVFYGLFVAGQSLNMMSMIGNVLLVGIVVNNAIVLVDYTNILRQRGMDRHTALMTACPIRLRPVLMTALTTIIGITPTLFLGGAGNEIRRPIAVAVIGGLMASTVLTLVVVPVIYTIFDDLARRLGVKTDTPVNETIEEMECRLYGTQEYCGDDEQPPPLPAS